MSKGSPEKKTAALQRKLPAWFEHEARDLPWRRTRDPYAVWVSEVMLQQTRVDQTRPYYEQFLAVFPTVHALAAAEEDAVLKAWEGLGYYSRARNLHKAAKQVVAEFGGTLPNTAESWGRLPGVGPYTAGAIASIAFGERVPVLDGNVKRVLSRVFHVTDCIDEARTVKRLWALAKALVPERAPGDMNQALMELGARVCVPKRPQCGVCPVRDECDARALAVQDELPVRRPRKPGPHRELVVAAVFRKGRYLIGKRPADGLLGGLWEFPGGELRPGETHQRAVARVAKETVGLEVHPRGVVATVRHAYTHFRVTLNVYRCESASGPAKSTYYTALRWVCSAHFEGYAFPKAHHKFLGLL
jgi:A/G-specific adenine glycosylase